MFNNTAELKGDGLPYQSERPRGGEANIYGDDHHCHHYVADADVDHDD